MSLQMQMRRDSAANWTSQNPILAQGEIGIELGSNPPLFKIGNGVLHWVDLAYSAAGGGSGYKVEVRTISSGEALAKQLTLNSPVSSAGETLVFVDGGSAQKYAVDFTVSGSVLNWVGLGLETIIETNDILIIQYKI